MGTLIVLVVVFARFAVPLAIPRYPLPAILVCLVFDAVDQTIFQQVSGLEIAGYQQYDKALDIFYLTVAYASTLRNWSDPFAFGIARFLFYYRLVGVVAFELSDARWLLLVFPNTFEYYFIAYEVVRTAWSPRRLGHRVLLLLAVGIWVMVKLPQEWWLHIGELDVTDEVKTRIFGVGIRESWWVAISARPWVLLVAVVAIGVLVAGFMRLLTRLPRFDWPFGFDVDARARGGRITEVPATAQARQGAFLRGPLAEKVVLVSLVGIVFSRILPGVSATTTQIVVVVAVIVVANSLASHWLAGRGAQWRSTVGQFLAVSAINAGIVLAMTLLPNPGGASVQVGNVLFFLLLLSLLVTLYDRYRMLRTLRRREPMSIAGT